MIKEVSVSMNSSSISLSNQHISVQQSKQQSLLNLSGPELIRAASQTRLGPCHLQRFSPTAESQSSSELLSYIFNTDFMICLK